MRHKKEHHYKQKLCRFFHGVGRGCRFPASVCINIHGREDQWNQQPQIASESRSKITCNNGTECTYFRQGECWYSHGLSQINQANPNHQNIAQTNNSKTKPNQTPNQSNAPNNNTFNMDELKLTLESLVNVVNNQILPNMKSMKDFPPIITNQKRQ